MKQVFELAIAIVLILSLLGCSRRNDPPKNDPPAAQLPPPGKQPSPSKEGRSYKETVENGLIVARHRYESADKYTPQFAASLVEEYDKLKRADPKLGPKEFWQKHRQHQPAFVEVEGAIVYIDEYKSPNHPKETPATSVSLKVRLTGWPSSTTPGSKPKIASVIFPCASQKVRSLQKGQSVILRGTLFGFLSDEHPGEEHPSGVPQLQLAQLVSPEDK